MEQTNSSFDNIDLSQSVPVPSGETPIVVLPELENMYTAAEVMKDLMRDKIMRKFLNYATTFIDAFGGTGADSLALASMPTMKTGIVYERNKARFDVLKKNVAKQKKVIANYGDGVTAAQERFADLLYLDPPWGGDDYLNMMGQIEIIPGLSMADSIRRLLTRYHMILVKLPYEYPKMSVHNAHLIYAIDYNRMTFYLFAKKYSLANTISLAFELPEVLTIWLISPMSVGLHAIKLKKNRRGVFISESLSSPLAAFGLPKSYLNRFGTQFYMVMEPRTNVAITKNDNMWSFGGGGFEYDNMDTNVPVYLIRCRMIDFDVFPIFEERAM